MTNRYRQETNKRPDLVLSVFVLTAMVIFPGIPITVRLTGTFASVALYVLSWVGLSLALKQVLLLIPYIRREAHELLAAAGGFYVLTMTCIFITVVNREMNLNLFPLGNALTVIGVLGAFTLLTGTYLAVKGRKRAD